MNTNIASLYDFTLQQMAAESYLEGATLSSAALTREALHLGGASGVAERFFNPEFVAFDDHLTLGTACFRRETGQKRPCRAQSRRRGWRRQPTACHGGTEQTPVGGNT